MERYLSLTWSCKLDACQTYADDTNVSSCESYDMHVRGLLRDGRT
jgi:hypothetical protein